MVKKKWRLCAGVIVSVPVVRVWAALPFWGNCGDAELGMRALGRAIRMNRIVCIDLLNEIRIRLSMSDL